jgi:putative transposase
MRTPSYPSDVTDAQWPLIEPLIPVYPGGRPRTTDLRDALDATLYILRTGCQWRHLPVDSPPKSTAWRYFDEWRHDGTLDRTHGTPRRKVRTPEKPYQPRTPAGADSQSVDTTSGGEARGRDNHKSVDGRERHVVVGSMGLPLAVPVTAASVDDGVAATAWFARLDGRPIRRVRRMFGDSEDHNHDLNAWVGGDADYRVVIVRRPEGRKGRVELPIRWTVERTFAWPGRCRRPSEDRERSVLSSEAFLKLAMIRLMPHRLEPDGTDAEFRYREAA